MPVQKTLPISMYDINSQQQFSTGYDMYSKFRNVSVYNGWSKPTGNPITFDEMRGAYYRRETCGYSYYSGNYGASLAGNYSGIYYYYWGADGVAAYRGMNSFYNFNTSSFYNSPYWSVYQMNGTYGRNYAPWYGGAGAPTGAVGDYAGYEVLLCNSSTLYVTGCYYWFYQGPWSHIRQSKTRWGYWTYPASATDYNTWYYNFHNSWYYGWGLRISAYGGYLYVGRYYIADIGQGIGINSGGPFYSSIYFENGVTGSIGTFYSPGGQGGPQNFFSVHFCKITGGWYCGATTYWYDYNMYWKNCASTYNFTTGGFLWSQDNYSQYWSALDSPW